MDGIKLSDASPEDVKRVTPAAQEAFLTQLFEVGKYSFYVSHDGFARRFCYAMISCILRFLSSFVSFL
jgi:hypothetical protein